MTVEPKRQKRPYSYYEKTINEYSYRSMERVSKTCPEKVEALLLRFPFDDSQDKQLRRALRRCRIYPGQGCYDDCYSAGMQAYLYSIHRCALARYVHFDVRASRRSRKQIQPISSEKIEICLVRFKSISSREHIHYFRKPA